MLQDIDELDQFRITVQHLESCRALILEGGEAKCRAALILLDHVSEVILYRIITEEYARDDVYRKIIPEEYPPKRRREIRRSFHSKLKVVTETNKLPVSVPTTLNILHSYRNATYHRDKHNPTVLPVLSRIALVATADLFARTGAGFKGRGVGGRSDSLEWLQRYGLDSDSLICFETVARSIASQMKRGVRPRLTIVTNGFVADVNTRLAAIREMLTELFPNGSAELINRTLKWFEFKRTRPELESTLSEKLRTLNYKIGSGHGDEVTREEYEAAEIEFRTAYDQEFADFKPTCRYRDLVGIEGQSASLGSERNFRAALARYARLDEQLTSFEQSTNRAYIEMEWPADMQADIARGK